MRLQRTLVPTTLLLMHAVASAPAAAQNLVGFYYQANASAGNAAGGWPAAELVVRASAFSGAATGAGAGPAVRWPASPGPLRAGRCANMPGSQHGRGSR